MKHLHSTYVNLKKRCEIALGCEPFMLDLPFESHKVPTAKLAILRIIQIWLFHESVIKLNTEKCTKNVEIDSDGSCCVSISGQDPNLDDHLQSVFPEGYIYNIGGASASSFIGFWKPLNSEDSDKSAANSITLRLEEKVLSISIERGFDVLILVDSSKTIVLISMEKEDVLKENEVLCGFDVESSTYVVCTNNDLDGKTKRGRNNRDCSKWRSKIYETDLGMVDSHSKVFVKYSIESNCLGVSSFKKLRESAKSLQSKNINTFCLCLREGRKYYFDLYLFGGQNDDFTNQDVSDLFETSLGNVQISKQSFTNKKVLRFECQESNGLLSTVGCIPESLRLITAVASLPRTPKKALILRFEDFDEHCDGEADITEIELKLSTSLQQRWQQLTSNEGVFVDSTSVPASILPVKTSLPIYACCANVLLLRGMVKVDGITLIPPGDDFIKLAYRCAHLPTNHLGNNTSDIIKSNQALELADKFNEEFWVELGMNLDYSEAAVKMISQIFQLNDEHCYSLQSPAENALCIVQGMCNVLFFHFMHFIISFELTNINI